MATVTFAPATVCAGGDHFTSEISVNGSVVATTTFSRVDLRSTISDEDRDVIIRGVARVRALGKTNAEVRSDMLAGFTVTI